MKGRAHNDGRITTSQVTVPSKATPLCTGTNTDHKYYPRVRYKGKENIKSITMEMELTKPNSKSVFMPQYPDKNLHILSSGYELLLADVM